MTNNELATIEARQDHAALRFAPLHAIAGNVAAQYPKTSVLVCEIDTGTYIGVSMTLSGSDLLAADATLSTLLENAGYAFDVQTALEHGFVRFAVGA